MIIQCDCKCGTEFEEFDKWGNKRRFVKGHQNKGKQHSPETKKKMSINHADVSGENNPMFGKPRSDEHKRNIGIGRKGITSSEETKQKQREVWIKRKQDPNYDPKIYGNSGEKNPNYGKPMSDKQKQKLSENRIGKYIGENSPLYGKPKSDEHKRNMSINRPDFNGENNPNYGKHHSPETKRKLSEINSGENHPQWKGGISKEPYCSIWTPWFKKEIKERDNHQCKNPDCWKTNKKLVVHHIDYNKKNCSANNLITLCSSCNGRANTNRDHWQELYGNIMTNRLTKVQLSLTNN